MPNVCLDAIGRTHIPQFMASFPTLAQIYTLNMFYVSVPNAISNIMSVSHCGSNGLVCRATVEYLVATSLARSILLVSVFIVSQVNSHAACAADILHVQHRVEVNRSGPWISSIIQYQPHLAI